jgi:mono/diheme cytochrome c family protein
MNSLGGACVRVALAALTLTLGSGAAWAKSPAHDAALVKQGAYLARAADCMPCHTGNQAQPYAGGLPIHTPFGILYSANITSDPQTGIGNWTFADFRNALHDGIRADGAFLYPAMPFDAFTKITEPDLEALWAYIHSLKPIYASDIPNQLAFPFNIRSGMLAWRELFFQPGYFEPTPGKSAAWNRGAYLVEALGHCSDCHSPRNIAGAIIGDAPIPAPKSTASTRRILPHPLWLRRGTRTISHIFCAPVRRQSEPAFSGQWRRLYMTASPI